LDSNSEVFYDDEIDLVQLAAPLIARWKLLLAIVLLGSIAAFIFSTTLPKTYESTASIFVQQNSPASSILKSLPVSIGGESSSGGYYITLLQSDAMRRDLITKLDLVHNPHFNEGRHMNGGKAIEALARMVRVNETKNGAIDITVQAKSPRLAARIANTMLDDLGIFAITASRRKADFIEKKLDETTRNLSKAEEDMSAFMEKNQVAAMDEQTKGMIEQMGELDAKLLDLDSQLHAINSDLANAGNLDDLVDKEVQGKSLQTSRDYILGQRNSLHAKLEKLPAVATQYARIQRRITVLTSTFQLLTEQYQLARITQKGEDGDYQIIDRAHPNPKKVAPRNSVNATLGGIVALVLASVIILLGARSTNVKAKRRVTRRKVTQEPPRTPVEHR
jgi:tyrosine-protein kinase Etk/Wzc